MILHTHIIVLWCIKIFLQANEVEKHPPKQLVAQGIFKKITSKSPFWVGMEPQKWPLAYIFNSRNRLRCRAVLPFAFTDWYDPKQHCKYFGWHTETYRNFFGTSQLKVVWLTWKTQRFNSNVVSLFSCTFTFKMGMKLEKLPSQPHNFERFQKISLGFQCQERDPQCWLGS